MEEQLTCKKQDSLEYPGCRSSVRRKPTNLPATKRDVTTESF